MGNIESRHTRDQIKYQLAEEYAPMHITDTAYKFSREGMSFENRLRLADSLCHERSPIGISTCADMYHELALTSVLPDDGLGLQTRAEEKWAELIRGYSSPITGLPWHSSVVAADLNIAYGPLSAWNITTCGDHLPDNSMLEFTYASTLAAAVKGCEVMEGSVGTRKMREDFAGKLAEVDVLLLLQRFSVQMGDRRYLPHPSKISERLQKRDYVQEQRHSWDVSVFTKYSDDAEPELAHKIQVRNRRPGRGAKFTDYDDTIDVVCLEDIVGNFKFQGLPLSLVVPRLIQEEQAGDGLAGRQLDVMQDRLFDAMG